MIHGEPSEEAEARLDNLWRDMYGVKLSTHRVPGVIERLDNIDPLIRTLKQTIAVGKFLGLTIIAATIVATINLVILMD